MHHVAFNAQLDDDMGRTTLVTCKTFGKFNYETDPKILLRESAITVQIGEESGTGWCEFCWNRDYLEFAKPYVQQFQPFKELTFARD